MKTPKDFYESELHVGDKVAFCVNINGFPQSESVRLGHIRSINFKDKQTRIPFGQMGVWVVEIEIEHLFNGGISVVKNLDKIIKLKIDALSPNYLKK